MRGAKVVAETDEFRLVHPHSQNFAYHRHWYYLRVEKIGSLIRFFIDGRLALQFRDPDPLRGGRIAFWSYHNGMMLARVRIWGASANVADAYPRSPIITVSRPELPSADEPRDKTFDNGLDGAVPLHPGEVYLSTDRSQKREGRASLRIQNAGTGGTLGVVLVRQPFDAALFPSVRFFCRIPAEVRVNLYALMDGYYHAFVLTGDDRPGGNVKVAGRISRPREDNEWHEVEVKLLDSLKSLYPHRERFVVEQILVGNLSQEDYLQAGFGGNGWGVSYHIDGFRLIGIKSNGSEG